LVLNLIPLLELSVNSLNNNSRNNRVKLVLPLLALQLNQLLRLSVQLKTHSVNQHSEPILLLPRLLHLIRLHLELLHPLLSLLLTLLVALLLPLRLLDLLVLLQRLLRAQFSVNHKPILLHQAHSVNLNNPQDSVKTLLVHLILLLPRNLQQAVLAPSDNKLLQLRPASAPLDLVSNLLPLNLPPLLQLDLVASVLVLLVLLLLPLQVGFLVNLLLLLLPRMLLVLLLLRVSVALVSLNSNSNNLKLKVNHQFLLNNNSSNNLFPKLQHLILDKLSPLLLLLLLKLLSVV
jgi:hypothetical protein